MIRRLSTRHSRPPDAALKPATESATATSAADDGPTANVAADVSPRLAVDRTCGRRGRALHDPRAIGRSVKPSDSRRSVAAASKDRFYPQKLSTAADAR